NVSSFVGELYSEKDRRRDAGFSIFYMGINAGAFLAPLITGTIGMNYNFHLGFGVAAVGMLIGLILFLATRKQYLGLAGTIVPNPLTAEERKTVFTRFAIAGAVLAILLIIAILT